MLELASLIVVAAVVVVALVLLAVCAIYYIRRRATMWHVPLACVSAAVAGLTVVIADFRTILIAAAVEAFNFFFGKDIPVPPVETGINEVLCYLAFLVLLAFVAKLALWPARGMASADQVGPKSNEILNRNPIRTGIEGQRLTWEERVRELYKLRFTNYKLHSYERDACIWKGEVEGFYPLYIYCCPTQPNDSELQRFLGFIKKDLGEGEQAKKIVAIESDVPLQPTCTHPGVDFVSEATLLDKLVDFTEYKKELGETLTQKLDAYTRPLEEIYVDTRVDDERTLERLVREWLADEATEQQFVLFGDYGCGKTIAAKVLSHRLFENPTSHPRIPIIVTLRGRSPRTSTVLENFAKRFRYHPEALRVLLRADRLLIILEGLDEVDLAGDRQYRRDNISELWNEFFVNGGQKPKILITTRPNYGFGNDEIKADLGGHAACRFYTLARFTHQDIKKALSHHCDEIVAEAEKNTKFFELISRPSMLHQVEVIWDELKEQESVNAASAMALYLEKVYRRASGDNLKLGRLSVSELKYFMNGIATHMVLDRSAQSNFLTKVALRKIVRTLVAKIPNELHLSEDQSRFGDPKGVFRERFPEEHLDELMSAVCLRGVLVNSLQNHSAVEFSHRSYMEFLAANVLAQYALGRDLSRKHSTPKTTDISFVTDEHILSLPAGDVMEWFAEIIRNDVLSGQSGSANTSREMLIRLAFPITWELPFLNGFYRRLIKMITPARMLFNRAALKNPLALWFVYFAGSWGLTYTWWVYCGLELSRQNAAPIKWTLPLAFFVLFSSVVRKIPRNFAVTSWLIASATFVGTLVYFVWEGDGMLKMSVPVLLSILPIVLYTRTERWISLWHRCCESLEAKPRKFSFLGERAPNEVAANTTGSDL